MESEKALLSLLSRLERLNRIIIVKDFVGFLNWNTSLGGILVPHVGHHCAFCTAMKQNEQAYACCVACARCINGCAHESASRLSGTVVSG